MLDDIAVIEKGWVCDGPCCKKELLAWNRIKKVYAEALKPSHNKPIMPCPKCELSCKMHLSYCGWCGLHLDVRCPVTA